MWRAAACNRSITVPAGYELRSRGDLDGALRGKEIQPRAIGPWHRAIAGAELPDFLPVSTVPRPVILSGRVGVTATCESDRGVGHRRGELPIQIGPVASLAE